MKKRGLLLAALAVASMAVARPASALDIKFDPTGGGGGVTIDSVDIIVGNSIAMGLFQGSPVGTTGTVLFQANLNTASKTGSGVVFNNCTGGNCFTVVAGFTETVVFQAGNSVTLGLNPGGPVNFFRVYKTTGIGDDLTGANFTSATEVLSGIFTAGESSFTQSLLNPGGAGNPLDNFGANNYGGISSLNGGGSFDTIVQITSKNAGYFPDLQIGTTIALVTSQLKLNYDQTNPSACFINTTGTASCVVPGATAGSVGAVNLQSGPNTIFQTDASAAFAAVAPVPEPATLTLLGLGLMGSAAARRRQQKNKK